MEEQNPIDFSKMNIPIPLWQWQCDPDPYKETDSTKWIWQNYPSNSCMILEKALLLNQEIADLGDYGVDLKRMLQINKKNKNQIRRVQRQASNLNQSRFMIEMPEPVIIGADQKTMNQAFGTVQHFLDYIMKRTPESYRLYQSLEKLSLDAKEVEFKEVIEEVILCIKKAAEAREKIIKTRSNPMNQNHMLKAEQIINEIKRKSMNLRDFLRTILRIYTMETFVCYWLNELLRSDNWTEINILTPYLVCLVYTFKLADYTVKYPTGIMNTMLGYLNRHRLFLYRGSALTKEQLAQYDKTKGRDFSWNGVTSTSRSRSMAVAFAFQSLQIAQSQNVSKVGILFVIETDFGSVEDCEGMIDVGPYAIYPNEKEVILAPGTVFQLGKIQLNKKTNLYEVNVKIRRRFEKIQDGISLLGALQDQAISKDRAIVEGIPSADSFRLLQLLEGNKLIQELEIRNSKIEEHMLKIIEKTRASTTLEKQDIRLINNTISVSSLSILVYYFSPEALSNVLLLNNVRFNEEVECDLKEKNWRMKKLRLGEAIFEKYLQNNEFKSLCDVIKKEVQITMIILKMESLGISEKELIYLWESIVSLASLESFCFTLNSTIENSGLNFPVLCKILDSFKSLKQLYLHLGKYSPISDERLGNLGTTLCTSRNLQHLDLDFRFCEQISDKGIFNINFAISSLVHLEHLSLGFMRCIKLSNAALNMRLASLSSLKSLSLNFADCNKISDKSLNYVKSSMRELKSLKQISLDFGGCNKISNLGLGYLEDSLRDLSYLQDISLEFWHCRKISDPGIIHISKALQSLPSLTNLSLTFGGCERISYQGGLKHIENILPSLKSLKKISLDFTGCGQISNGDFECLQRAVAVHTNKPCLSLNQRAREDFDPQGNREFRLLSKAYSSQRRVLLMLLMFYLVIRIFGFSLLFYVSLIATALFCIVGFIAEMTEGGAGRIKTDFCEQINLVITIRRTRKQAFWTGLGLIFVGLCLVFWRYGLRYAFLALLALYPVGLVLQAFLLLVAFVLFLSFGVAYCLEASLIEKLNNTVGNTKNQYRVQDVADIFSNYLDNFSENFGPIKKLLGNFGKPKSNEK